MAGNGGAAAVTGSGSRRGSESMALAEYTGMTRIKGPIVLLKGIPGVGYD